MIELQILLDAIKFFDIKLFDQDFYELLVRLCLNICVAYSIIFFIYKSKNRDSDYVFTFLIFNPIIFFICHLFSKVDLSIGFAFGLFAVFSILRYRTVQINVKEMTFMFIVISIAVINALATKKVSYTELLFTNFFILGCSYLLEKYTSKSSVSLQVVKYEKIENIKPENKAALLEDLRIRVGKTIVQYEVVETDYIRDIAVINVFYKEE